MSIGVLGGTFDPVHNGHLSIAGEAMHQLGLESVIFIPAGQPRLKARSPMASAVHRIEMVKLAIEGKPHFSLSTLEVERTGPTYTVDTINSLRHERGLDTVIYFLMGSDAVSGISHWKEPQRLIEMSLLAVVNRPGAGVPDIDRLETTIPGISRRTVTVTMQPLDISSTDIRLRISKGLPVYGLVPVAVERYIQQNGLYR